MSKRFRKRQGSRAQRSRAHIEPAAEPRRRPSSQPRFSLLAPDHLQLVVLELAGFHDGIRADVDGNIWCGTGFGGEGVDGIHVYAPDGARIGQVVLPEATANLCFVGRHRNRLFMAASQSVYTLHTAAQGAHIT